MLLISSNRDLVMNVLSVKNNIHTVDLKKWNNSSYHSVHQWLLDCGLAKAVSFHTLKVTFFLNLILVQITNYILQI